MDDRAGLTLRWVRPDLFRREYILLDRGEPRLYLRFHSFFGGSATLTEGEVTWTLERTGIVSHAITVIRPGSPEDGAALMTGWTGTGEIELSGARFRLSTGLFWQRDWWWEDGQGTRIVDFHVEGLIGTQARVELAPGAGSMPALSLLLGIGWQAITLRLRARSGGGGTAA